MNLSSDNSTNEPTKAAGNKQKVAKQKGGKKERRQRDREREKEGESGRGADSCLKCCAQIGPQQQQLPFYGLGVSNRLDAH